MNIFSAAVQAPWLAFGIAMVFFWTMRLFFLAFNRWMRSRNIARQGWPTNPIMDADGDIVHPSDDD